MFLVQITNISPSDTWKNPILFTFDLIGFGANATARSIVLNTYFSIEGIKALEYTDPDAKIYRLGKINDHGGTAEIFENSNDACDGVCGACKK